LLGGLFAVAALFGESGWSWLLWVAVGIVAGSIAGRPRLAWLVWPCVAIYHLIASAIGLVRDPGPFWLFGAIIGGMLASIGFVVGTAIGWRADPRATAATAWRGMGRDRRRVVVGSVVAALLAFGSYLAYAGIHGSNVLFNAARSVDCRTPADRYGWPYEAVNYDIADDANLARENPDRARCATQGTVAGTEVVTPDGARIAGWYIPAADGSGPTGPTLLLVHGGSSNKSEFVRYAVPFHEAYNVLVIDLRNAGRSSDAWTTLGVREQLDVEAMVDWLDRTKHPAWIGAVGDSMGAGSILAAAVDDARIEALILDSMHASFVGVWGGLLESNGGHPSVPGSWAIAVASSLRLGVDVTSVDPVRLLTRLGDRPVLLLHGTSDAINAPAMSAEINFHAALDTGVPVELQYCRGAGHAHVIDTCPREWARWSTTFLEAARGE
jgi:pimeloyl-ACP methyl ester carboxylesterase